jgi:hypothetical protein
MNLRCKCLISLLSISAFSAVADDDNKKFSAPAADTMPRRDTISKVTIGVDAFDTKEKARPAFGKTSPYEHGVLPVLVVIKNDSGQALRLDNMKVEYIRSDRQRIEATPASDVPYVDAPKRPNMGPSPIPIPIPRGRRKSKLDIWEIEGRAFSARMLPVGESAHGFFYFQTTHRPGAKIYITGMREASSAKELFYFEIPLD